MLVVPAFTSFTLTEKELWNVLSYSLPIYPYRVRRLQDFMADTIETPSVLAHLNRSLAPSLHSTLLGCICCTSILLGQPDAALSTMDDVAVAGRI